MEVDGGLVVLSVSEPIGVLLDGLDLGVEPFADGAGDAVGEEVERTPRMWRAMVRAASMTGWSRECVAQKYQRRQCRVAQPRRT